MDITNIKQDLLILFILFLWATGLTDGDDVTQTPILWKDKGENATMHCSHTKDVTYSQMYWYRQLPGETMKQILFVFTKSKPQYESGFKEEKFSATKPDAYNGTLTVKNLVPEDKGLYFCAVRRQGTLGAYFGHGTKLTVLEPGQAVKSPKVKVFRPSSKECRNPIDNEREKTLVCVASDFYPDHVSVYWQIIQLNVTSGVTTDEAALRKDKVYTITSRLKVSAEDWYKPEWNFECIVRFFNGTHDTYHNDSISGEQGPDILTREKYLRITRQAKLSYSVLIIKSSVYGAFVAFLVWRLQSSAEKQNH